MSFDRESFEQDGAALVANAVPPDWLARIEPLFETSAGRPGQRVVAPDVALLESLGPTGPLGALASEALETPARPVRILLFDKSADANWAVAWHQDRQIAVAERREAEGFRNWTRKDGIDHVEPPFDILEHLITLRLHLDDCGLENGPLLTLPGSHRFGRIEDADLGPAIKCGVPQAHTAARGDVLVLRTSILHASARASKPTRRRVLHVEFSPDARAGHLDWALKIPETA